MVTVFEHKFWNSRKNTVIIKKLGSSGGEKKINKNRTTITNKFYNLNLIGNRRNPNRERARGWERKARTHGKLARTHRPMQHTHTHTHTHAQCRVLFFFLYIRYYLLEIFSRPPLNRCRRRRRRLTNYRKTVHSMFKLVPTCSRRVAPKRDDKIFLEIGVNKKFPTGGASSTIEF